MSSLAIETQEGRAQSVKVTDQALMVDLVDGRTIIVPLVWFPRLWHGTNRERNRFEIFGDGAYLHWPDLDEDLTVEGLLAGRKLGESPQSLGNGSACERPNIERRHQRNHRSRRTKQRRACLNRPVPES